MTDRGEALTRDPDVLTAMVRSRDAEIARLRDLLKSANDRTFGQKSEKASTVLEGQIGLDLGDIFSEAPKPAANDDVEEEAPADRRKGAARAKPNRNLGSLPEHLERVIKVIEPSSLRCHCCQGTLHKIGEESSEALASRPATLYVLKTIRPKYGCRSCRGPIVQAPAAPRLFDGGLAATSLISNVVVWRYAWYMPINRQAQMLKTQGIRLDPSTLCGYVKRAAWWLAGLYKLLLEYVHSHDRIFVDETRMPVLKAGLKRTQTCQFWAHAVDDGPWNGPAHAAVAYIFALGRRKKEIQTQLLKYTGILQVDGYKAYKGLTHPDRKPGPIRLANCMAHARRKYVEAFKKTNSKLAQTVIERLREIYHIEADIRGTSAEHRLSVRQARTAPLMAALKTFLMEELKQISSNDSVTSAINYTLSHWSGLTMFLEDGRIEIDSNTVERTMRSVALGRVNSLFAGNDGGAESWATLGSLLTTAKLNGLDPYTWLNDVLERIVSGEVTTKTLYRCLPWHWKTDHPEMNVAVAA